MTKTTKGMLLRIGKVVLPRRLRRWLRWQQARRAGVVRTPGSILERTAVIDLSDDCATAHIRHGFEGAVVEREQSPAVSLYQDPAFVNLGVPVPDLYTVRFRGISLDWIYKSGVWPPTLDSYVMVAALADSWPRDHKRIWEVGCGTGIIGLHLLRLTSCEDALLTDVDPRAIEHTKHNAAQMGLTNLSLRVEAFPPPDPADEPYDLLVSNPPYFPPNFEAGQVRYQQATDDLYLTRSLFEQGLQHAKRVVVGFSSVMLEEIESYVRALGPTAEWHVLRKVRIPLTVTLADPRLASRDGIFSERRSRFPRWHDFYVGELRRSSVPEAERSSGRTARRA